MTENKPRAFSYVRFSSIKQAKGDSLRRQTEAVDRYVKANNLVLDTSLSMKDEGISAFSGANIKEGALGVFLALVKGGKIPFGSILIVESLDRVSRQKPRTTLRLFLDLVDNGIGIHTLLDNQTYTSENIDKNVTMLYMSLGVMQRSYDESVTKSERLASVWRRKRENAVKKGSPMTTVLPHWVTLDKTGSKHALIPERAEIIKRIYTLAANGKSAGVIAKELNDAGVKPWNKKGVPWRYNYIVHLLNSRAIIGEYQPTRVKNKKRTPAGDPIKNFFPSAIDMDLFYKVQKLRGGGQKRVFKGKTNKNRNLFSGLLKCGYCNASMISNDSESGGGIKRYIVCNDSKRNKTCPEPTTSFPKDELEAAFLALVGELDISAVCNTDGEKQLKIVGLQDKLAGLQGKFDECETAIGNFTLQLAKAPSEQLAELLSANLEKELAEKAVLEQDIARLEQEIGTLQTEDHDLEKRLASIKDLHEHLKTDDKKTYDIRCKLRSEIRQIIDKIVLYPLGLKDRFVTYQGGKPVIGTIDDFVNEQKGFLQGAINDAKGSGHPGAKETIKPHKRGLKQWDNYRAQYVKENSGKSARVAHVHFLNGAFREISFNPITGYSVTLDVEAPKAKPEINSLADFATFLDADPIQGPKKKPFWHPDPALAEKHRLINRIIKMRDSGLTFQAVADKLNGEGVTAFQGGQWLATQISRTYKRYK